MKLNNTSLTLVALIAAAWAALSPAQAADSAPNAAGNWTWTVPGRNGGPDRKNTLKLKVEGDKLSGVVASPGRDGQVAETPIEEAKIHGDDVSFKVVREVNGNKFAASYAGKVSVDAIKGKIETERDGSKQSRDWEAKREVAKP